jgi:hypothetical protein
MEKKLNEAVEVLIAKAKISQSHEAMHYSQAALNLMHALQVRSQIEQSKR